MPNTSARSIQIWTATRNSDIRDGPAQTNRSSHVKTGHGKPPRSTSSATEHPPHVNQTLPQEHTKTSKQCLNPTLPLQRSLLNPLKLRRSVSLQLRTRRPPTLRPPTLRTHSPRASIRQFRLRLRMRSIGRSLPSAASTPSMSVHEVQTHEVLFDSQRKTPRVTAKQVLSSASGLESEAASNDV